MSVKVRYKKLKRGDRSYYLDIYHHGERQYEFLDIYISPGDSKRKEKLRLIERIRALRELELSNASNGIAPKHRKNCDFIKYFESFLEHYPGKDKRLVKYALVKFKKFVGSERLPSRKVTRSLCDGFAKFLKDPANGLSGETPHNYWRKFRRVTKQATRDGIFLTDPSEGIKVTRITGHLKKNVLTAEELSLLAKTECNNGEVKRAFLFACFTGLGVAEIRKLTRERVIDGKLRLYREKNGQPISIDLHPFALDLISPLPGDDSQLFTLPSDVAISKSLKLWVADAGIQKHISFYCGRHTFGTLLARQGTNLKVIADCMGHSSTKHTVKYLNHVDDLKAKAIANLPDLTGD